MMDLILINTVGEDLVITYNVLPLDHIAKIVVLASQITEVEAMEGFEPSFS